MWSHMLYHNSCLWYPRGKKFSSFFRSSVSLWLASLQNTCSFQAGVVRRSHALPSPPFPWPLWLGVSYVGAVLSGTYSVSKNLAIGHRDLGGFCSHGTIQLILSHRKVTPSTRHVSLLCVRQFSNLLVSGFNNFWGLSPANFCPCGTYLPIICHIRD